ncbi:MAG: hypothetical protein QXG12_05020 [Thermoproteota archaeon]
MNIRLVKRFFLFLILANVLNTILALIATFFYYSFENSFVTLFLFEGGIMLTYGGLWELEGTVLMSQIKKEVFRKGKGYSSENHKKKREKANFFIGIGLFLVCESILLSLLLLKY